MMIRKFEITLALILTSAVFGGCSKTSEPETAKIINANQATAALNNNSAAAVNNNAAAAINSNAAAPIVSNEPPTNAANAKKPAPPANEPKPQIGSGAADLLLLTQVRGALAADKELINAVIVELKEGNATLTGNVASEAQKAKAAQLVQGVSGIKSVKNNLRVSS